MTWDDWQAKHAVTFGMSRDFELDMLAEWVDTFKRNGFSVEEAVEATLSLASHPPKSRGDHLRAILDFVRSRRRVGSSVEPKTAGPYYCDLCSDSGRVTVPHLDHMALGEYIRASVLCRCDAGISWQRSQDQDALKTGRRRQTTIDEYEHVNPNWVRWVAEYRAQWLADIQAAQKADALDRQFGRVFSQFPPPRSE